MLETGLHDSSGLLCQAFSSILNVRAKGVYSTDFISSRRWVLLNNSWSWGTLALLSPFRNYNVDPSRPMTGSDDIAIAMGTPRLELHIYSSTIKLRIKLFVSVLSTNYILLATATPYSNLRIFTIAFEKYLAQSTVSTIQDERRCKPR